MKALLVGGSGGTGVHIARGLEARGFEVTLLHRGIHEPEEIQKYRHIHADPHFREPVEQALGSESFDVVVLSYGRLKDLAALFSGRCQRLLAIGAVAAYAGFLDPKAVNPHGMPLLCAEDAELADAVPPVNARAAAFGAKIVEAERAVMHEHERGGYIATLLRYPAIYGPNAVPIPATNEWSFVKRIRDGRPFVLLPNGGLGIVTRCASINAAHAALLALDSKQAAGEIFNVSDEDQFAHAQWVQLIAQSLGASIEIVGLPPALNGVASHLLTMAGTTTDHILANTSKARTQLGYRDVVRAADALAESVRWRAEHPPASTVDPFDYALEDRVYAALEELSGRFASPTANQQPLHSYPHPKEPGQRDHRGR
jgi:nucleoside-diphosphate-sugar epimerase